MNTTDLKRALGHIGIWSLELRFGDPAEAAAATSELDALGFGGIWIPGGVGGNVLADVDRLLAASRKAIIATGIINVWKHEPAELGTWWRSLPVTLQARTLVGLGISHGPLIGTTYARPLATMREYLDGLAAQGLPPESLCIAALGPKMLELARDRTAGSHPYLVPPEHTATARKTLGPAALLAPEQGVVLETDPTRARELARKALDFYRHLPNYSNNWQRLGFSEEDITNLSDRLIDALFAWGSPSQIGGRVKQHLAAGADHVCLQVITGSPKPSVADALPAWRALAAELL